MLADKREPTATPRQMAGLALAVCLGITAFLLDLGPLGKPFLVLVIAVVLWVCEVLPIGVTGVLSCFLLYSSGAVPSFPSAFSGYTNPTTWFILAVSVIGAVMSNSSIGKLLCLFCIRKAGSRSERIVLAFMVSGALVSTILNDVAAIVLILSLLIPFMEALGLQKGSNFAKALMLGVTMSCIFGGMCTPVSHALNIIAVGVLEAQSGSGFGFIQWMAIGVPVCIAMILISWRLLVAVYPPEEIDSEVVSRFMDAKGSMTTDSYDKKAIVIVVAFPVLCIAGNWVPFLSVTNVALLYLVVLFVPGLGFLTWDDFRRHNTLDAFLMLGGIMSLTEAIKNGGGEAFIVDILQRSGLLECQPLVVLLVVCLAVYLILSFCPAAPAVIALVLPPLLAYAAAVGLPLEVPTILFSIIGAGSFLLPLTPVAALTYQKGYYGFLDLGRVGWLLTIVLIAFAVMWAYFLGMALF